MTTNNPENGAPESPRTADQEAPKPETPAESVRAAAAEVLAEAAADAEADAARPRRGRPPGRVDRRPRKRRGSPVRVEAAPEPPAPPAEPTEAEIVGLAGMLSMGWRMAGARLRRRPLTDSEARELARAAHPVLAKYGGAALEQWGAEITLAITLFGLWDLTALPQEAAPEVFELGGAGEVAS